MTQHISQFTHLTLQSDVMPKFNQLDAVEQANEREKKNANDS
jgi:hypothetical protein